MTTVDEAPDDSRQEYGWGLAPSHLRTRRQLREMGKSPGQSLVALMVGKVRGRRVVARLFDPDLAPAKRVPSDAQLAAIRKATTEHQLRAAERRGFSRTEMSAPAEPAPGWEQEPTLKEGNPMSDTETQSSTELGAIRSEVAALAAGGQIDPATARFIDSVASGSGEAPADPPQIAVPTGHGQRMAYLRATVATNQARHRDELLAAAAAQAQAAGEDAVAEFLAKSEQGQTRAEERIAAMEPNNPAATVAALADAMVWHENSQPAATALAQLRHDYAEQWGVRIDPRGFTVELDPDFDPVHAQDDAEAWQLRAREDAVLDSVSAMALPTDTKGPVMTALSDWRGIGVSRGARQRVRHGAAHRHQRPGHDRAVGLAGHRGFPGRPAGASAQRIRAAHPTRRGPGGGGDARTSTGDSRIHGRLPARQHR
ncbi:hypothetical protein [Nocardia sp. IFM 10818]